MSTVGENDINQGGVNHSWISQISLHLNITYLPKIQIHNFVSEFKITFEVHIPYVYSR